MSTQARPRASPAPTARQAFAGPTGSTLTTDHPLVIDALKRAASAWPAAVWVRDLLGRRRSGRARALCDALLRSYAANLVALHVHPPRPTTAPGDAPRATALARHQAAAGETVTNLRHASVRIEDDLGRRLVTLLDGTRDRAALAAELRTYLLEHGRRSPTTWPTASSAACRASRASRCWRAETDGVSVRGHVGDERVAPPGRGHTQARRGACARLLISNSTDPWCPAMSDGHGLCAGQGEPRAAGRERQTALTL